MLINTNLNVAQNSSKHSFEPFLLLHHHTIKYNVLRGSEGNYDRGKKKIVSPCHDFIDPVLFPVESLNRSISNFICHFTTFFVVS